MVISHLCALSESIILIDPDLFLPITENGLDNLIANPVPSSRNNNSGRLSDPAPIKQQLPVRKQSWSRTYNRQPHQRKTNNGPKLNPVQIKSKKIQKVSPNAKKVTTLFTKETQTWVSRIAKSTQTFLD